jgi:hypothetical protein
MAATVSVSLPPRTARSMASRSCRPGDGRQRALEGPHDAPVCLAERARVRAGVQGLVDQRGPPVAALRRDGFDLTAHVELAGQDAVADRRASGGVRVGRGGSISGDG